MYVSIGRVARDLGVSTSTVRRWTETGLLSCVRTAGGHRRVASEDAAQLKRALRDGGEAEARRAREREVETLVQAAIDLASVLDQQELLAAIAKHVTRICDCTSCAISAYDEESNSVCELAEYSSMGRRMPQWGVFSLDEYAPTRRVLREQTPLVINVDDPGADPWEAALLRRFDDKSVLLIPLVFQGRSVGLLEALDRRGARRYSPQELRLCRALAGHAAVAMRNAELFRALNEASSTNDLGLRIRMAVAGLEELTGTPGQPEPWREVAELVRTIFVAESCLIACDGAILGSALAQAGDDARASSAEETSVTRSASIVHGVRYEILIVGQRPLAAADIGLLDLLITAVAREPLTEQA